MCFCNRILYIILSSTAFQSDVWVWRFFCFLYFLFKFCTFHLYRSVSYVLCIEHYALRSSILIDISSLVLLWIKMLTAYLKKINAVHRSVCMFVATYVPQYFGCLVYNKTLILSWNIGETRLMCIIFTMHKKISNHYNKACFLRFQGECLFHKLYERIF